MTPRQIEYVLAVVQHRTMRKAGEVVFARESTISQQIAKLEKELGIILFCQSRAQGRPLALTEAGKQILPDLQFYLNVHNDVFRRAASIKAQCESEVQR